MLLIAFGTRPEWIKIKPVIDAIKGEIPYKILFTGQHTSLISSLGESYSTENVIHLEMSDACNTRLDSVITSTLMQIPEDMYGADFVMVQGDTSSAFAVALAAFHRQITVIHLEAGLRTYDNLEPYPEEFNRQAIGSIADLHLCATEFAYDNLMRELKGGIIQVVGNTVLDHLTEIKTSNWNEVLVTMHRRENHELLDQWFTELNKLAVENKHLKFILPIHPNPNVKKHQDLLTDVEVIDPLPHNELLDLLARCKYVITDSGGIQEESAFLRKPCLVCRDKTERSEGLGSFSWLCTSPDKLSKSFGLLKDQEIHKSLKCPYGDGKASEKILKVFKRIMK